MTLRAQRSSSPDLRASFIAVAACGAALALGALVLFGRKAAMSVGIGAVVAEVNLWTLARIVSAMLRDERAGVWTSVAFLKMLALFVVVGLLMRYPVVAPLSMIVGFGALPIGIAIGSLLGDRSVLH
jgi:ATP synthase I subunit